VYAVHAMSILRRMKNVAHACALVRTIWHYVCARFCALDIRFWGCDCQRMNIRLQEMQPVARHQRYCR
jgi:hypothetical protein